ncbi:MAG: DUF4829 domain-containing protein [Desulfitobacteriaceae bacterium]
MYKAKSLILLLIFVLIVSGCMRTIEPSSSSVDNTNSEHQITLSDQNQVKQVITNYFKTLNNHNFHEAYSLWAPDKIGLEEAFTDTWKSVESIQIISIKPYLITSNGPIDLNNDDTTPTLNFGVTVYIKNSISTSPLNGTFTFFPNLQKSLDGSWRIYGMGTSR